MPKSNTAKKAKSKPNNNSNLVHDILNRVKDGHEKMDRKLEELAQMCAPKELRIK